VGYNHGTVTQCYSTGAVTGDSCGGLVGDNRGSITTSYSTGSVSGAWYVGGLVGDNYYGTITHCYSTSAVSPSGEVGGLVGRSSGTVTSCFWDKQTSGMDNMCGIQEWGGAGCDDSRGRATTEMQTGSTFLDAGWDFVGETANGTEDIWKISEGLDYPRLSWQKYSGGTGEPNDPYQVATAEDLMLLGDSPEDYDKHFILTADIDLDPNLPGRRVFDRAVITPDTNDVESDFQGIPFTGVFNGSGHTISHLTITGVSYLGLFGQLGSGAMISNLCLEAVAVNGTGHDVGGLVGSNWGNVTHCYSSGSVSGGGWSVGGLAGYNDGSITRSYNTGTVNGGNETVGGLVGENNGSIAACCSTATVSGTNCVGGLVGQNNWRSSISITASYSTGTVGGARSVGGLVGYNSGRITTSYSTGKVSGNETVGGLAGYNQYGSGIIASFWDMETSGLTTSDGGTGKTTAEMQTAGTFLEAGWDFVDEAENGTEDIWDICEGIDYPRLAWQLGLCADHPDYDEWVEVGEPICWCFSRHCHGDTDGKSQGKKKYWVSTDDLDILIAAWNKPFAEIEAQTLYGLDLVCADFDHKAQGKQKYRVSTNDLDILIANWNKANAPAADCP
jgi:hypothetical protein